MNRLNMFAKISLLLLCAVAVPTIALGYLSFAKADEQIKLVTSTLLTDNLMNNTQRIEALLAGVERRSEAVLGSEEVKALLREPPLQTLLEEYDFARRMNPLVAELKGEYELAIYPRYPADFPNYAGGVTGEEDWFVRALELEGRGEWYAAPPSSPEGLVFVRAIRDFPQLHPIGVLAIRVPSFMLTNQILPPERLGIYRYDVLDAEGRVIAAKTAGEEPVPEEGPYGGEAVGEDSIQPLVIGGRDYFYASRPAGEYGWRTVVVVAAADLLGPVETIKQFTWMLVASGMAFMTALLLIIVRSFTVPIKKLVLHMRKIMRGELVYFRQFERRGDEIGQLIGSYNYMVSGMQELLETTKRFEEEKRRLEIRTLVHQMNPHFLYNTMDTIKWKADRANEPDIVKMVTALSNLLRFSINNDEELTTIERELEHAKNYLSIEQMRSHDSFSVFFQVQPAILHFPFMKLTLQPIVENAVKHAMKRLPEGQGKMIVSLFRSEDAVVCRVEDNGPGAERLPAAGAPVAAGGESGVGLYNVDRRLKLRFGERYGVTIENRPEGGCRVTIVHPLPAAEERMEA